MSIERVHENTCPAILNFIKGSKIYFLFLREILLLHKSCCLINRLLDGGGPCAACETSNLHILKCFLSHPGIHPCMDYNISTISQNGSLKNSIFKPHRFSGKHWDRYFSTGKKIILKIGEGLRSVNAVDSYSTESS